ncbi:hypothetical protein N7510_006607 [Penicillium lagena]|uniref:uncharacterized protein n=1 Tax=Penicillium lagena TaxID=94218 RepID=UPI0025420B08|nr:uncharacterized protein N7510_006607 [Penicillium lagena]KAJ5613413.1 hypothetical protein N7510_006607 [Penicillium lagena]
MRSTTPSERLHGLYSSQHKELFSSLSDIINKPSFKEKIARRLSEAVRIPTEVGDGMGHVGEDSRWEIFYQFSKWLRDTYPSLFTELKHTVINEHAHLFTWEGSDRNLKPLLLMAHSDVVPVTTWTTENWTHKPFSGHYDGKYIWGRGSEDDKANVVAILSTLDLLLAFKFKPARTIIMALGFDEEGGAEKSYGARCLAEEILRQYGKDGIELIFDEGMASVEERHGREFALPATSEKGYLDVTMRVDTPGGLSQEPPDHTSIGFLAQAVQIIEDNPFTPTVSKNNPGLVSHQQISQYCSEASEHSADPSIYKASDECFKHIFQAKDLRPLIQTSTAVTVIHGGDKVNSLPESSYAMVNHRIAPHDSVRIVKDHYICLLYPWAEKHRLAVHGFGEVVSELEDPTGTLTLISEYDLDPSPISDSSDPRFELLAGTIRGVFGEHTI